MDDNQFLQAVLPAAKGGLGVSSDRLLALPAFLASAVGAKDALSEIFGLEHVDGTYDDALKRWFDLGKIEMAPENEIQKNWTEPIFDSEIADLILRLEPTDIKKFNAFQDRFGSQWLNVIPCKILRLKLSNQQLRIAIGLRLGSKTCERHKCVCGKDVTVDGWHVVVVVVVVVDLQHKADGCYSLSVFIRRLSTYFCIGCNRTQVAKCKYCFRS